MPAFRNIGAPQRMSARLEKRTPVVYDNDGWPITDGLDITTQCIHEQNPPNTVGRDATTPPRRSSSPIPATINPSSLRADTQDEADAPTAAKNATAPRRGNHSRRREPGHVPRPRNAFIFFRSHFIATAQASGEGQQNELSKLAGKAWTKMSEEEKHPFALLAAAEKKQHALDYPNYVYAPGRSAATKSSRTKGTAAARRGSASASSSSGKKRASKQRSRSPEWDSDEPDSPTMDYLPRSTRAPRAAARRAVQRLERQSSMFPSPSPGPLCDDAPEGKSLFSQLNSACDGFVPTEDIPDLELTPSPYMAPESPQMPTLHVTCIPSHQETSLLAAGFRPYLPSDALNTMLPVIPEVRRLALDNHTLNELHYDYSVPIPHDTTAQPLNLSLTKLCPDIVMNASTDTQYGANDFSAAYAGGGNCNGFEYYDLSPTDFDSPMDEISPDDLYRMFIRSPSPVEALL